MDLRDGPVGLAWARIPLHSGGMRPVPAWMILSVLAVPLPGGVWQSHTPYHGALDAVAQAGQPVVLEAWFRHGALVQKDVERAPVRLAWQKEGRWEPLAELKTDGDGHAAFLWTAPATGPVKLRWSFKDQHAEATLWVVPVGQPVVVFDIDGTLTPSDRENLKDYARRLVRKPTAEGPKLRPGAVAAAHAAAREGLVVYVTGRPPWLAGPTRAWLAAHDFPEGAVFCMTHTRDILPTEARVGRAKTERFRALQAAGVIFLRAYGNARTDIRAYAAVGLPKDRTFILGKHGGEEGTVALGEAFPP